MTRKPAPKTVKSAPQPTSGGCFSSFVDLLTAVVLLVIVSIMGFFALVFMTPGLFANTPLGPIIATNMPVTPKPLPTLVSVAVVPTVPTATPTATRQLLVPTWTPVVEPPTITMAPTFTRRPTETPSSTPIFPTKTPTPTRTPTPTMTPTETPIGPTATASPTRSTYPFTKSENSPYYLQNFANDRGCDWSGVAGEVLNLNRVPVALGQFQVHVWGFDIDARVPVGGAVAYGPSGWEQFLFTSPNVHDYNVQLETVSGTAVSIAYSFQTRSSCNQNLVKIDFVQNH